MELLLKLVTDTLHVVPAFFNDKYSSLDLSLYNRKPDTFVPYIYIYILPYFCLYYLVMLNNASDTKTTWEIFGYQAKSRKGKEENLYGSHIEKIWA